MNWIVIILFSVAVTALIIFLIARNRKDEKQFEEQIKNDYPKSKDDQADIDAEDQVH